MVRVNVLNDAFKSMYKAKKGGKRQVPSVSFSMSTITELEIEDWTARLLLSRQVMCNGCTPAREPIPTNKRHNAAKIFSQPNVIAEESWYDIEQEYSLMHKDINCPLGWPVGGCVGSQLSKDALWCWCRQNLGMRHNPFSLQGLFVCWHKHHCSRLGFSTSQIVDSSLFVCRSDRQSS